MSQHGSVSYHVNVMLIFFNFLMANFRDIGDYEQKFEKKIDNY